MLDEMLRDRLVGGVRDIRIRCRLLAEPKLTLKGALDLALAIEAVDKDVSEIQKADGQGGGGRGKLIREAKSSTLVVAATTTPKAVILKMRNAIVVIKLAI